MAVFTRADASRVRTDLLDLVRTFTPAQAAFSDGPASYWTLGAWSRPIRSRARGMRSLGRRPFPGPGHGRRQRAGIDDRELLDLPEIAAGHPDPRGARPAEPQ